MKILKFKFPLLVISSAIAFSPLAFAISCSNNGEQNYKLSENITNYSTIWNMSLSNRIKNSIFDLSIKELEDKINDEIKNNKNNDLAMKSYCFYLLWNAIKNPKDPSGATVSNLSQDIIEFSTFLSEKLKSDNEDEKNDSKKTYNNFKKYIESFNYKISIVNISHDKLDSNQKIRDIFLNEKYVLNFKFDFWTNDEKTNEKMISKKNKDKSIMFVTKLTREQRSTLNKIKNLEIKELVKNQYTYQGTKLYYDVKTKKFSSILLPSNVYSTMNELTLDSGFLETDKNRSLFEIQWYSFNENAKYFGTYIDFLIDSSQNFSTTLSSDWTNFLKKEKLISEENSYMKKIKLNLNIYFDYEFKNEEKEDK